MRIEVVYTKECTTRVRLQRGRERCKTYMCAYLEMREGRKGELLNFLYIKHRVNMVCDFLKIYDTLYKSRPLFLSLTIPYFYRCANFIFNSSTIASISLISFKNSLFKIAL